MYLTSMLLLRMAGKKEVSQLELSELITSFMVSEIAAIPISDPKVPLYEAIVFSFSVIMLNTVMSKLSIRLPFIKHIVAGKPEFLIIKGKLQRKGMLKAQVTLSELVSAMRKEGICSLENISYAVLEPDGNISVIANQEENETGDNDKNGLQHMLIADGKINKSEADLFGFSESKIKKCIKKHGVSSVSEVFFFGIDDKGNECLIKK